LESIWGRSKNAKLPPIHAFARSKMSFPSFGRGFDSHRPLQFVQDKASNQSQLLPTIAGFLVAHETTFHFMPLAIAGSG